MRRPADGSGLSAVHSDGAALGWDTWGNTWLRIAHAIALNGRETILAGRLRNRPSWRGSSTDTAVAKQLEFAAWLRSHIQPCYDTSLQGPAETARRVATWVRRYLSR
jgi:hypothetical protein